MKKFVEFLGKIPLGVMMCIIVMSQFIHGIVSSFLNVQEATIVNGFTTKTFIMIIIGYSTVVILNGIDRFIVGTAKGKMVNQEHMRILEKVLDSKMSNINNVSSGKIFDVAKDLASCKAGMKICIATLLYSIPPASVLIWKESRISITAAIISVVSIPLGVAVALIAERLIKFSETSKKKKEDLHGICADNFINIRTLKYLNLTDFKP